jgi:hypothetical protein
LIDQRRHENTQCLQGVAYCALFAVSRDMIRRALAGIAARIWHKQGIRAAFRYEPNGSAAKVSAGHAVALVGKPDLAAKDQ